jgi:protein-S-isoprenylcysteine O-methyltransferase Ste14
MHNNPMSRPSSDTPQVPAILVPPPVLATGVLAIGLVLDWLCPVYVLTVLFMHTLRITVGLVLIGAGGALLMAALHEFRRAGTPVMPQRPSRALATGGIYGYVRNPIYVGGIAAMVGLAVALAADWLLLLTIPMSLTLHYGVVLPEERYLASRFGAAWLEYAARVSRYGWPD